MSIRALHYITGDTQQSGFRCIGGSDSFPADHLPYLNNGMTIQERARVESGSSRSSSGIVQMVSHVWEYQTGKFGTPVVINTKVAIQTGRAHGFSEYVAGLTDNVAEMAEPGKLIRSAEELAWLNLDDFMQIQGRDTVDCPEESWDPDAILEDTPVFERGPEETWRLTLLSHYWKQASIRAFSEDPPTSVRVSLGEFSENIQEDIEETIRQAKRFFSDVIVRGLPKQVQNIASMAAGVNCSDRSTLYTALEFDITQNLYEEETLHLDRPRELRGYRLNEAEIDFIRDISTGRIPDSVQEFFNRYRELVERPDAKETEIEFMADYRVLYAVYCLDGIAKGKHTFIEKAGLTKEHGNPHMVRDARACYTLMVQLRKILEKDHRLNEIRRTLVTELTESLETAVLKVMMEDMSSDNAEPFLLKRSDMVEFHRRTLYMAPENQLDLLYELAVADARAAKGPQFVRCYPSTPLRDGEPDKRNAQLLGKLLPATITPLIDAEANKEKTDNKYLNVLRSSEFVEWVRQRPETKTALDNFLRGEIQSAQKHFLLYGLCKKYLPMNELLRVTLKHFIENNSTQNAQPNDRQLAIAVDGAQNYISGTQTDPECVRDMNLYYQACFRDYRGNISNLKETIVKKLGGDTSEAMKLIFDEAAEATPENRMRQEEAEAVFDTFGGADKQLAKNEPVKSAYINMLKEQQEKGLESETIERGVLVRWLGSMLQAAPFEINTSGMMVNLFKNATDGERLTGEEADQIFEALDPDRKFSNADIVRDAYSAMISAQRDRILNETEQDRETSCETLVKWIAVMAEKAPFQVDTSDSMKAIFESARTGKRMSHSSAEDAFRRLMPHAVSGAEKVRSEFSNMVREQLDAALANKEENAVEWIGGMISASSGSIDFDTTNSLVKIFESAKEGGRICPADAEAAFNTMASQASSLDTTVQRAYTDMLSVRRKEGLEKGTTEYFDWLCEMADRSPWNKKESWINVQHTENISMLCELSYKTAKPADDTSMTTVQGWMAEGSITPKVVSQLQNYCNYWLENERADQAELFTRYFKRIDEDYDALRNYVFNQAKTVFLEELGHSLVSFGALITDCQAPVERSGKKLDDLYKDKEVETAVEEYLNRYFENNSDLPRLINEQDQIPINNSFYRAWQDRLSKKVYDQQVGLFNKQPNLEKLKELKEAILKRSPDLHPSLKAAYQMIESFENRLDRLNEQNEYEVITNIGSEMNDINLMLDGAKEVRKVLCSSLRNVEWPALEELKNKSFRHEICASMMQAILTDNEREVTDGDNKSKGCPDWNCVLNNLFTKAELDEATRKPYAPEHLQTLQRLLSLGENVRLMKAYGMDEVWASDFVKTVHSHSDLHTYQSALGRNKKKSDEYQLVLNTDGLKFDLTTP